MTIGHISSFIRRNLPSVATAAALCAIFGSCRSSKLATLPDEGFFEPLRSIDRSQKTVSIRVDTSLKLPLQPSTADSVRKTNKERLPGTGEMGAQPRSHDHSRSLIDSSQVSGKQQPRRVEEPLRAAQPELLTLEGIRRQFEAESYKATIDGCEEMLRRGVPKNLEDQYQLILGTSYYHLSRFDLAAAALNRVVNLKGTKLKPDAYFVLGQIYKQLGVSRTARKMFEAVVRESPGSDWAAKARQQLSSMEPKQ